MARSVATRLGLVAVGSALLAGSGALARRPLDEREIDLFRRLNDGPPDALRRLNWALMLGGTFWAVPAVAGTAWWRGRHRLAVALAGAGTTSYLLAKAVKPVVGRARPRGLLDGVTLRDEIGGNAGWVSGHAAVSTALALVAWPELDPLPRAGVLLWAVAVDVGRVYAGAHMPLDVAGGVGLGMLVAAVVPSTEGAS